MDYSSTPTIESPPPSAKSKPMDNPGPALQVLWPQKFPVLQVLVSATTYQELTQTILRAAQLRQPAIVSCHAVHAIVTASDSPELCQKVNSFDAVTPDGQPVRWALRWLHRVKLRDRVYGPELMVQVCRAAAEARVGVYLYGGTPEVLERLTRVLRERFPDLKLHGDAPPFRPLTAEEDQQVVERIAASGAGIVFIGLGCPKQDEFAFAHRDRLDAVQICVGAAFDFHAGVKPMAPRWMQRMGLEWLFRLWQEPRRLWRRYLYTNSRYLWLLFLQFLRKRTPPN